MLTCVQNDDLDKSIGSWMAHGGFAINSLILQVCNDMGSSADKDISLRNWTHLELDVWPDFGFTKCPIKANADFFARLQDDWLICPLWRHPSFCNTCKI